MNNKHKLSTIILIVCIVIIGGGTVISGLIGDGTDNTIAKWFNGTLINSNIIDDNIGINISKPLYVEGERIIPSTGGSVNGTNIDVNILIVNGTDVGELLNNRYNEFSYLRMLEDDQCGVQTTTGEMWYGTAIDSGTTTTSTGYMTHPCVRALRTSATANSGYALNIGITNLLLNGSESTDIIFNKVARTGVMNKTNITMGFQDSVTVANPTDGVYIGVRDLEAIGIVRSNNVQVNTSTNFTLIEGQWYRSRIEIINGTFARFYIYNSTNNTGGGNTNIVWTDTVTGTLPVGTSRQTGHGIKAWVVGGTAAADIVYIDYMNIRINKILNR
jgi:hypothetical protein